MPGAPIAQRPTGRSRTRSRGMMRGRQPSERGKAGEAEGCGSYGLDLGRCRIGAGSGAARGGEKESSAGREGFDDDRTGGQEPGGGVAHITLRGLAPPGEPGLDVGPQRAWVLLDPLPVRGPRLGRLDGTEGGQPLLQVWGHAGVGPYELPAGTEGSARHAASKDAWTLGFGERGEGVVDQKRGRRGSSSRGRSTFAAVRSRSVSRASSPAVSKDGASGSRPPVGTAPSGGHQP